MKCVTPQNGPENEGHYVPSNGSVTGPEWVVGRRVSGDDYSRLPVGSKVKADGETEAMTKTGPETFADPNGHWYHSSGLGSPRTLIHLPDGYERAAQGHRDALVELKQMTNRALAAEAEVRRLQVDRSHWPAFAYLYGVWGYALNRARDLATEKNLKTYLYRASMNGEAFWVVSWDPKDREAGR